MRIFLFFFFSLVLAFLPTLARGFVTQDSFSDHNNNNKFSEQVYFADEIAAGIAAKRKKMNTHLWMPHFVQLAPKPPSHSPPKHVLHQALSESITTNLPEEDDDEEGDFHAWAWDEV